MEWKYFEWDYGKRTVKEWQRSGHCCKCMECCQVQIMYNYEPSTAIGKSGLMGKTVQEEKGVWLEARYRLLRLFISGVRIDKNTKESCRCLIKSGCAILRQKKTLEAPLCATWPIHPSQVEPFEKCSYTFELINEEDF